MAIPDLIAATIDLDALAHDYRAWLIAAGVPEDEEQLLGKLDWAIQKLGHGQRHYADFLWDLHQLDLHGDTRVIAAIIGGAVRGKTTPLPPARSC